MNSSSESRNPQGAGGREAGGAGVGDVGKDKRPLSARLGIRLALDPEEGREEGQGGSCRTGSPLREEDDGGGKVTSCSSSRRTTTSTRGHGSNSSSSSTSSGSGGSRAEREEKVETPVTRRALEASRKVVSKLKASGINLLALDFDMTVLDIHTGGQWAGKASELCSHIRPFFSSLILEAGREGIHMAVVTFSPQTGMIREVLKEKFGEPLASLIPVRGADGSWVYSGKGSQKGKQGHMASAVEELCARCPSLVITRGSTVLIDDDRSNIDVALKAGVRAFWLDPCRPEEVVESLLGGMGMSSLPPSLPPSFSEEGEG
ncbi:hypothetical protein VYU27_003767 [Nannochloropsis oceanica]